MALMGIKNEQSRRYIATLGELNAVREKLDGCEATRGTAGASLPRAVTPDDITPLPAGISGIAGDLSKAPEILPEDPVANPDRVGQIRSLPTENRSLQSGLAVILGAKANPSRCISAKHAP